MDDSQAPFLSVGGLNEDHVPQVDRKTFISVTGTNFPPGIEVTVNATGGQPTKVDVDADGNFGWGVAIAPQLSTTVVVSADATYIDPANPEGPPVELVAHGTIVKDDGPPQR